jgi:hypothetical protein
MDLRRFCCAAIVLLIALGIPSKSDANGAKPQGGCVWVGKGFVCVAGVPVTTPDKPGNALPPPLPCAIEFDRSVAWPVKVENGEAYYLKTWRCGADSAWTSQWLCASCDPVPVRPPPPSPQQVFEMLVAFAKKPIGRFAPPVERPGVRTIYGKRFYFRADPISFATQTDTLNFPGRLERNRGH